MIDTNKKVGRLTSKPISTCAIHGDPPARMCHGRTENRRLRSGCQVRPRPGWRRARYYTQRPTRRHAVPSRCQSSARSDSVWANWHSSARHTNPQPTPKHCPSYRRHHTGLHRLDKTSPAPYLDIHHLRQRRPNKSRNSNRRNLTAYRQ